MMLASFQFFVLLQLTGFSLCAPIFREELILEDLSNLRIRPIFHVGEGIRHHPRVYAKLRNCPGTAAPAPNLRGAELRECSDRQFLHTLQRDVQ